jgi:hypothetical protein
MCPGSSGQGGGGGHYSYKIRQLANENGVLLDQSQYRRPPSRVCIGHNGYRR